MYHMYILKNDQLPDLIHDHVDAKAASTHTFCRSQSSNISLVDLDKDENNLVWWVIRIFDTRFAFYFEVIKEERPLCQVRWTKMLPAIETSSV